MTAEFGPQTAEIQAVIARAGTLTLDEAERLAVAWATARSAPGWFLAATARRATASGFAARNDAALSAAASAQAAALRAVRLTPNTTSIRNAAGGAAWETVGALAIRDLLGDQFTQAHYDLLTGPWRQWVGPIHPDDQAIAGA